jgi:hypothetical protein
VQGLGQLLQHAVVHRGTLAGRNNEWVTSVEWYSMVGLALCWSKGMNVCCVSVRLWYIAPP